MDFLLSVFFFYIDESGSPELHHLPILSGETPLFCLTAIAVHETRWRLLGSNYLTLKQRFFKNEIGSDVPLAFEVKGSELSRPSNKDNRRNHAYIKRILELCDQYELAFFSIILQKGPLHPASRTSIYTMSLQYLAERFQAFLVEQDDTGLMIVDSRKHTLDLEVANSYLSYIFGNVNGKQCDRMIEAPMFTDSRLTTGLQIVDTVGSCIYSDSYYWRCRSLSGALDYSHMRQYRPFLKQREFHSQMKHHGYPKHGYRFIKHD